MFGTMAAKITEVVLECAGGRQAFAVDHAERILAMRDSGWWLPEGSEYEMKDGSISRRDKKGDGGAKKA